MELRGYWRIVRRRLWILIAFTLLTGLLSFWLSPEGQATYAASIRMVVSIPPEPKTGNYYSYEMLNTWLSSEYLVDDLGEVVKSAAFAQDMKDELKDDSLSMAEIAGSRSTQKTHRILTLKVTSPDPERARRIAEAAARVVEKKGGSYIAQLNYANALIRVIDPPSVARQGSPLRSYLDIGLRTALGFVAGLALVFLLHYLDDRIHEIEEVERLLGLPLLGEIPPEG